MPNASSRPKWNPWIALGGAAVLVALAFGLLAGGGADAAPVKTFGLYGPPEPPPISNLTVKPLAPKRGKGFKATFTAGGPIKYRLYVLDKIDNRYILIHRKDANGTTTTPRIGKRIPPGQYELYAGRLSTEKGRDGRDLYFDELQQDLVIRK